MPIDPAIIADNAAERQRLEAISGRLSEAERDLDNGWTVATALAHLAFWDRRASLLLRRWETLGTVPDTLDVDLLNESLKEEWRALEPQRAADLAVTAARMVDSVVEALDARVVQAVQERGNDWLIHRDRHRREHLDQIERIVQR